MADICVLYASENEEIAEKLVTLLRRNWEVWWAGDIAHGDWDAEVRHQINSSSAVVPLISHYIHSKPILRDEISFALKKNKYIFPFIIEEVDLPFGLGTQNNTQSFGWDGNKTEKGFAQLEKKITSVLPKHITRKRNVSLRNKDLELPNFIFSLSSYDTQVRPEDGLNLFRFLEPTTCLISAYDAWKLLKKDDENFINNVSELCKSNTTLFLDCGNYEAYRRSDIFSKTNESGWSCEKFREIAGIISPDISFAFDEPNPEGTMDEIAEKIISNYYEDENKIPNRNFPLCPIVHLPTKHKEERREYAAKLVAMVTSKLDPVMIAIPERELGSGIIERFITVRDIRRALNELGKYYPLHLLGAGNPISIFAFASAGADSFDGLEWCRTVADYENDRLFHFSHFDCFDKVYLSQIHSQKARLMVENEDAPYTIRVASYNFDYFNDSAKTMRDMVLAGQIEHLLKNVPNIGTMLFEELKK